MSLSSRPSIGLPSNPRARSATAGPARQDIPSRPQSSASVRRPPPSSYNAPPPLPSQPRSIRPQRSMTSLPSAPSSGARSRSLDRRAEPRARAELPPPLPGLPTSRRVPRGEPEDRGRAGGHASVRSVDNYGYRRNDDVFSDSASSSGGSGAMSPLSAASSRTSMDGDEGEGEEKRRTPAGHGSSLWTSITSVASNLTVSVSKAWSSNIPVYSGEETPVGGESRLTRAMKEYHIAQARSPADLPEWLFDERARGVRGHQADAPRPPQDSRAPPPPSTATATSPSTGSRPSRSPTIARRDEPPPRPMRGPTLADRRAGDAASAGSAEHVTKSMERLRALRDAKRNAKVRFHGGSDDERDEPRSRAPPSPPPSRSMPAPVARASPTTPTPRPPQGRMPAPLGAGAPLGVRGRQPPGVGLPAGVRPLRA
ncbi:hypothetical protein C2E23DRAFT_884257 [Lenzites betulinus]|nr:hypothetical protein C2E23DRAFT_884257 [Lenzites betulinus]